MLAVHRQGKEGEAGLVTDRLRGNLIHRDAVLENRGIREPRTAQKRLLDAMTAGIVGVRQTVHHRIAAANTLQMREIPRGLEVRARLPGEEVLGQKPGVGHDADHPLGRGCPGLAACRPRSQGFEKGQGQHRRAGPEKLPPRDKACAGGYASGWDCLMHGK